MLQIYVAHRIKQTSIYYLNKNHYVKYHDDQANHKRVLFRHTQFGGISIQMIVCSLKYLNTQLLISSDKLQVSFLLHGSRRRKEAIPLDRLAEVAKCSKLLFSLTFVTFL